MHAVVNHRTLHISSSAREHIRSNAPSAKMASLTVADATNPPSVSLADPLTSSAVVSAVSTNKDALSEKALGKRPAVKPAMPEKRTTRSSGVSLPQTSSSRSRSDDGGERQRLMRSRAVLGKTAVGAAQAVLCIRLLTTAVLVNPCRPAASSLYDAVVHLETAVRSHSLRGPTSACIARSSHRGAAVQAS